MISDGENQRSWRTDRSRHACGSEGSLDLEPDDPQALVGKGPVDMSMGERFWENIRNADPIDGFHEKGWGRTTVHRKISPGGAKEIDQTEGQVSGEVRLSRGEADGSQAGISEDPDGLACSDAEEVPLGGSGAGIADSECGGRGVETGKAQGFDRVRAVEEIIVDPPGLPEP